MDLKNISKAYVYINNDLAFNIFYGKCEILSTPLNIEQSQFVFFNCSKAILMFF